MRAMLRVCCHLMLLSGLIMSSSCRYAKDYVTPTPDFPAPFSFKPAAIQLAEMHMNGTLRERYIYRNGHLAELHYILMSSALSEKTYGISYYERQGGIMSSFAHWNSPDLISIWYGGNVGPLELLRTLTFQPPQRDTLREATLSEPNRVGLVSYGMNAEGYLINVSGLSVGSKMIFERNAQNNVAQVQYHHVHEPEPTIITYEYDNHPNPFFAMGRMNDLAVDTSPNNVIRSVTRSTFTNEIRLTTTTYEYTYRSDRYPEKVVVRNDSNTINNRIVYKYNEWPLPDNSP